MGRHSFLTDSAAGRQDAGAGRDGRRRWPLPGLLLLGLLAAGCTVQPKPLSDDDQTALATRDRERMFQDQPPIAGPVSLYEAMARSILYNLDHRLKRMEDLLSSRQLDLSRADLLPTLLAAAGYTSRSNAAASISQSMQTGTISLEASTSQERDQEQADLSLTWNALDFGVSYFRAQQEADQVLITRERRRKVVQNLMREVRFAYWKALGAQESQQELRAVLEEASAAQARLQAMGKEGLRPPLEVLQNQRSLMEMVGQLERLRDDLTLAHTELAPLLNVPPATPLELGGDNPDPAPAPIHLSLEEMERLALQNRPELREENYQARISVAETRKAMARLFPGLEFSLGANYDSNAFLVNQHWSDAGARLTWNLLNLASAPARLDWAKAHETVTETRRLALHMAILGQVHIAYRQYLSAFLHHQRAMELDEVERCILAHAQVHHDQQVLSGTELLNIRLRAILARVRLVQTRALLQQAQGQLQVALGVDPVPMDRLTADLPGLTRTIRGTLADWQRLWYGQSLTAAAPPAQKADPAPAPDPAAWRAGLLQRVNQLLELAGTARVSDPSPPVPADRPEALGPAAPASLEDYSIRVAAFLEQGNADALVEKLRRRGYDAMWLPLPTTGGHTWHSVRVGRFPDPASARPVIDRLVREEGLTTSYVAPYRVLLPPRAGLGSPAVGAAVALP
ncbi:MAG: TolC family protein [Magnetococcales bacterium]|nr:TolC family protein [Magnetococcales bacterium]